MIDKLSLRPSGMISVQELKRKAASYGILLKSQRWKGGGHVLKISHPENGIVFRLSHDLQSVFQIITRPAAFQRHSDFIKTCYALIEPESLLGAIVFRCDLAIDIQAPIQEILMGVFVEQKIHRRYFDTRAGTITGVNFGKRPETIVIYNKSLLEKKRQKTVEDPLTRIEVQSYRSKLTIRTWEQFVSLAESDELIEHCAAKMKPITLSDVTFCNTKRVSLEWQRFISALRAKAEIIGIQQAFAALDPHRNANRRSRNLYHLDRHSAQPIDLLRRSLRKFVNKPEEPQIQHRKKPMTRSANSQHSTKDMLTVKDAAAFLKIHPDTLRNWTDLGKVAFIRHPTNRYRLFEKSYIEVLANQTRGATK